MALNAGGLVHRVTIQRPTAGSDESGFPQETWTTLCQAWMSKQTERGAERFSDAQFSATSIIRWTMRYRADCDPDLVNVPKERRLLYQNRPYDIQEGETMDRKEGIMLRTLASTAVPA